MICGRRRRPRGAASRSSRRSTPRRRAAQAARRPRAQQELLATGARPRRPRFTGAQALTASERRVATLAARGESSRQFAVALYISVRTVENHLANCYRKLGISSRHDLYRARSRPTGAGRRSTASTPSCRRDRQRAHHPSAQYPAAPRPCHD
jgi:DNA-binding CsgD family transcriptional regulator